MVDIILTAAIQLMLTILGIYCGYTFGDALCYHFKIVNTWGMLSIMVLIGLPIILALHVFYYSCFYKDKKH